MMAVGPAAGVATGVLTGGFAAGAAWLAPSREVEAIRTSIERTVRIGFLGLFLANNNCTQRACGRWLPLSRAGGGLQFAADPFGFAKHPQQVPAQDLTDLVGAIAA